ncbi:SA1002 family membrane protein [Streptococcus pluranimalium]|uniref:SA1002 family membrane protein n=1 Tax=Streptococcus pluranimalium TaxID=82348 RepID=UPI003BF7C631
MVNYILVVVLLLSDFLANLTREKRFHLVKATIIVSIETCLGVLLFTVFIFLSSYTVLNHFLLSDISSLFSVILLIAVINGFLIYWVNVLLMSKFKINHSVQILCEYIIQWSLIYITVYQVLFDNLVTFIKSSNISQLSIKALDIADPADLILLVLPSLISVWISVILYRLKFNEL